MSKIEVEAKLTVSQEWISLLVHFLILTVGAFIIGYFINEMTALFSSKESVVLDSYLEWVYRIWTKGIVVIALIPLASYVIDKWLGWSEIFVSKMASKIK